MSIDCKQKPLQASPNVTNIPNLAIAWTPGEVDLMWSKDSLARVAENSMEYTGQDRLAGPGTVVTLALTQCTKKEGLKILEKPRDWELG